MCNIDFNLGESALRSQPKPARAPAIPGAQKRPHLFLAVFVSWAAAILWFHPRLWSLTEVADGPLAFASIAYFVVFAELAWLYGFYNIAIVVFALVERFEQRRASKPQTPALVATPAPAVAVLYTTCNDFSERSAQTCVDLSYPNFRVYILDDSDAPEMKARVDAFARANPDRVQVVRRGSRRSFKAGNLNHALYYEAREPYFAVVDADEILPTNFLSAIMPTLMADPKCGFVQANHRSDPQASSTLARDMGIGVDIHWKWYQPLRNNYGFVMFLGHGAVIRRSCWEEVGGFPEIVSEDLGFAISIRSQGYYGVFEENVICLEEFPETIRAFRVRHVKWTRGTCEFLHQWTMKLLRAPAITTSEKIDILLPTLNLPLTLFYFVFMINAQFLFPFVLGEIRPITFVFLGHEFVAPIVSLSEDITRIFGLDFYAITIMTILAPVLCFILDLWRTPVRLFRFLAHSTATYAALSTLSFIAVLGYGATRKAQFYVTGDVSSGAQTKKKRRLSETHPDSFTVRCLEIFAGFAFLLSAIATVQPSFAGVALAFMLLPLMHRVGWNHPVMRRVAWLPFLLFLSGLGLGVLGVAGLQPVFFGFGFHF